MSICADRAAVDRGPAFSVRSHLSSHRHLVPWAGERTVPGRLAPPPDVVAVPASRPASGLREVAGVAAEAGSTLLVLASRETSSAEAQEVAEEYLPADRIIVVEHPTWRVPGVRLATDRLSMARRTRDTSGKRNFAIVLARLCGWERVVFLDDDVTGFRDADVRAVRQGLVNGTKLDAIGWTFDAFPDNSMVCHAYRLAGADQSTFIGGGALAVRVGEGTPHFPAVYNEDWLFMLPLILRPVVGLARVGSLFQAPYDPFRVPADAQKQEFGDLLAEGMFRILHNSRDILEATQPQYWKEVLSMRLELIDDTREKLLDGSGPKPGPRVSNAVRALKVARRHYEVPIVDRDRNVIPWNIALSGWVDAWHRDCRTWGDHLASLDPVASVADAIRRLGLQRRAQSRVCRTALVD